jgi:hypothetical protein
MHTQFEVTQTFYVTSATIQDAKKAVEDDDFSEVEVDFTKTKITVTPAF